MSEGCLLTLRFKLNHKLMELYFTYMFINFETSALTSMSNLNFNNYYEYFDQKRNFHNLTRVFKCDFVSADCLPEVNYVRFFKTDACSVLASKSEIYMES